MEARFQEAS
jgi:hypothetical protein